ncbi:MAG: endolytic transglycosylase MltG [Candidatus Pacebacteria bacterium]|nr:endolytic transglycosylase MltG [Candidatus Paceibacterota bacterium]
MKLCFLIIIFIIFLGIFFIWPGICLPKNPVLTEEKLFLVEKGDGLFQIAENLEKEDLIKSKFFFDFYVLIKGGQDKLRAGEYFLSPSMNVTEIAGKIILGEIAKIMVTIPEGFTVKQIEELLGLKLPGTDLEGFLFPDTYQFPLKVSGEEVVKRMRDNFEKKLTQDLREEIEKQDKTIFEIVTMASLLEKEVKTKEDKRLVSGISWKRFKNNIPLQVDATITYITGKKTTKVSIEETKIDSPYNTYKYLGLPLGPICNPGLESIKAAVNPEDSDYWYYLSTPEGETYFSETLEDHNIKKAKYLK